MRDLAPRRRRARATLLWSIGLFVAGQLTIGLLLDYVWPLVRFPSAGRVMARLAQQPQNPEVVFLGSSRFECGIRPAEIGQLLERACRLGEPCGVFNGAVPAGDPISAEFVLHTLLERGVRPRLVVLEVSPEQLNYYNEWLGLHVRRQLTWADVPGYLVEACWAGQGVRFLSARLFPLFLHRQQVLEEVWSAIHRGSPPVASAPASAAPESVPVNWDELLQPPQREMTPALRASIESIRDFLPRHWLYDFHIRGNNPAALGRILTECRRHGIGVLLLAPPLTEAHRQCYGPAIESAFQEYLAGVQAAHGCRFVDCRAWLPDPLFVDNHHLDADGALYFSRLLTHRVLVALMASGGGPGPEGRE
jgi:hypothetical protein